MGTPIFRRYDGKHWTNFTPPATTMASPGACAAFNGSVYCAYQGVGGAVTVATLVGHLWEATTTIPGAVTPTTPALAVFGDQLVCVYQSNGSVHASYLSAGSQWTADAFITLADGQYLDGIYGSPALVEFNDLLFCFYQVYNHTGNLRVATYDGTAWVQVGGKKQNLPEIVPGMAFSPAAAVLAGRIWVLYQEYDGDGDNGDGTLTSVLYDGVNWSSHGRIVTNAMSASPAAAAGTDGNLNIFFQGPGNDGTLVGIETDGRELDTSYTAQVKLLAGTAPAAAIVPVGSETWLIVNGLAEIQWPVYSASTAMPDSQAQGLLDTFAPVVYLSSQEKYYPASVDWFLQRVSLDHWRGIIATQPAEADLPIQKAYGDVSFLIPNTGTPFTTYIMNTKYKLAITEASAYYGMQPIPPNQPQAPFYGAVIDNPGKYATDLLYMFFYGWNGLPGHAILSIGAHEGDWEHVIVRLDRTKSRIIGMFVQAHKSDDPFSTWYYVAGDPQHVFSYYGGSSTRPVLYSAAESHASYTTPGAHPIGEGDLKGDDQTDAGALWNAAPNVVLVSMPVTPWLQFAGRWGSTAGLTATSPDPPAAQGWLIPRSDGPTG
jgi:hypothetical protein